MKTTNEWMVSDIVDFWRLHIAYTYFENQRVNFQNSSIRVFTWLENKFAGIMTSFP